MLSWLLIAVPLRAAADSFRTETPLKQRSTFIGQNTPAASGGSLAYVSSATPATLSSTQTSIAITGFTATTGNNLMVFLSGFSSAVSGVTIADPSSNTYTAVGTYAASGGGGNNYQYVFCAHGITGFTSGTVTLTATGLDFPSLAIDQFSGTMSCTLDGSTSANCLVQNSTTGAGTPTGTFTTTNAHDLLYPVFYADNSGATWSALTSGFTLATSSLGFMVTAYKIVSTIQTGQTIAATNSTADGSLCMVAIH